MPASALMSEALGPRFAAALQTLAVCAAFAAFVVLV